VSQAQLLLALLLALMIPAIRLLVSNLVIIVLVKKSCCFTLAMLII
jgi:hypothetical protein